MATTHKKNNGIQCPTRINTRGLLFISYALTLDEVVPKDLQLN